MKGDKVRNQQLQLNDVSEQSYKVYKMYQHTPALLLFIKSQLAKLHFHFL